MFFRMFVEVIKDVRYFIFIFVLTIVAFALAFFIILKNNGDFNQQNGLITFAYSMAYIY